MKTFVKRGAGEKTRCNMDDAQMANSQFFNITKFA